MALGIFLGIGLLNSNDTLADGKTSATKRYTTLSGGSLTGHEGNFTGGEGNFTVDEGNITGGYGSFTGGYGNFTGGYGSFTGGHGNFIGGDRWRTKSRVVAT